MILMGALLVVSAVTAAVGVVVVLILLSHPPLPLPKACALVALILFSLAVALYCHGWFSVVLGGPFPELCGSGDGAGAEPAAIRQQYWPLRSACVYSDGSTVEYVPMSVNVGVCLLAGSALASAGISVFPRGRFGRSPGAAS
ncbi:hypothetical protein SUDANB58_02577 [Streptomyces sp. enrichment culture]|uniref:hypothetical protein n=1 Tax=Streptomyces sp. enrichment culture TaxID=1795815 RepID=UPI003F5533D2